jgi:hypothetical protein
MGGVDGSPHDWALTPGLYGCAVGWTSGPIRDTDADPDAPWFNSGYAYLVVAHGDRAPYYDACWFRHDDVHILLSVNQPLPERALHPPDGLAPAQREALLARAEREWLAAALGGYRPGAGPSGSGSVRVRTGLPDPP